MDRLMSQMNNHYLEEELVVLFTQMLEFDPLNRPLMDVMLNCECLRAELGALVVNASASCVFDTFTKNVAINYTLFSQ